MGAQIRGEGRGAGLSTWLLTILELAALLLGKVLSHDRPPPLSNPARREEMTNPYDSEKMRWCAPWWQMLAARWLGRRVTGHDFYTDTDFIAYWWRGVFYVWDTEPGCRAIQQGEKP